MGTKVQSKSYLPGYNLMRDINENVNGGWSLYDDKKQTRPLYSGFVLKPVNGYSEYDKEMMRRTMLEHEAIFKRQVYDLHRLYQTQKILMDELKTKELYKYPERLNTSLPSSFPPQLVSESTQKMSNVPHFAVTGHAQASVAGNHVMRPSLNFLLEKGVPSAPSSMQNGVSETSKSMVNKTPKRMFDLQLAADVYIQNENTETQDKLYGSESSLRCTDFLNGNVSVEPVNAVKLTLGTCEDHNGIEESWKSDSRSQNGISICALADLNEPAKEACYMEPTCSNSMDFFGPMTDAADIHQQQLPLRSKKTFPILEKDFLRGKHGNKGTSLNFLGAYMEEVRQEWPHSNASEQSRSYVHSSSTGLCNGRLPLPSEAIELKLNGTADNLLPHQSDTNAWFTEKPHGVEISGQFSHLMVSNYSTQLASHLSVVPHSEYPCTPALSDSSWPKLSSRISHIPVAVQALPCFGGSVELNTRGRSSKFSIQSPNVPCDKWGYNGNSWSYPRRGREYSSYQNGFNHDLQDPCSSSPDQTINRDQSSGNCEMQGPQKCLKSLQDVDVKSAKDVNLDQVYSNRIQKELMTAAHADNHHNESSGGLSWLQKKPSSDESQGIYAPKIELSYKDGYYQLMSSCSAVAPNSERYEVKEKRPSLCGTQDFPSALQVGEIGIKRTEMSDSQNGKQILSFPILEKNQQTSTSHSECFSAIKRKLPGLANQLLVGDVITERDVRNGSAYRRNYINLNSDVNCMDDQKSSDVSHQVEDDIPSPVTVPTDGSKIAPQIDLEAPPACLVEEDGAPQGETSGRNQTVSSKVSGSPTTERSPETTCAREAAESIIAMSLDSRSNINGVRPLPSFPDRCEPLHWFAGVVVTSIGSAGGGDGSTESLGDDELDLFEFMTLRLKETEANEYFCKPQEQENHKAEEKGFASLLLTRPRRGQARRRQRRDFQKDILPSLVSLTRHEVTDDLQTIGGLVRASGRSRQTSSTRRNAGQNASQSPAKGTRRPRSLAVTVAEVHASPTIEQRTQMELQKEQPIPIEVEDEGSNIKGWGRTTRRCRRPRSLPGYISTQLT